MPRAKPSKILYPVSRYLIKYWKKINLKGEKKFIQQLIFPFYLNQSSVSNASFFLTSQTWIFTPQQNLSHRLSLYKTLDLKISFTTFMHVHQMKSNIFLRWSKITCGNTKIVQKYFHINKLNRSLTILC